MTILLNIHAIYDMIDSCNRQSIKRGGTVRFLIQVVSEACVEVTAPDGTAKQQGQIGKGALVLIGIGEGDDEDCADKMVQKLLALRIFADEAGKTNLSLSDVNGALLVISQFTLYADCRRGNRPSFTKAGSPEGAKALYDYIVRALRERVDTVEEGVFGAHMRVSLTNEGPFTILLDSEELSAPRRG